MLSTSYSVLAFAVLSLQLAWASPVQQQQRDQQERRQQPPGLAVHNNFNCKSSLHPNPVILLHGLGATYYEDINYLEYYLQTQGFCTFSLTYGAYDQFPYVGGLKPIQDSSQQVSTFINQVKQQTGANKIDLVGHSEGAFLSIYVAKFGSGSPATYLNHVFAIAPPTHGTTFAGLYKFAYLGGNLTLALSQQILNTVGCAACADLGPSGDAVTRLNTGPIAQSGIKYTILTSKFDELVTPPEQASFIKETGVRNLFIQDFCPFDPVGHIGEAYDLNTYAIVKNALSDSSSLGPAFCSAGSPGR